MEDKGESLKVGINLSKKKKKFNITFHNAKVAGIFLVMGIWFIPYIIVKREFIPIRGIVGAIITTSLFFIFITIQNQKKNINP